MDISTFTDVMRQRSCQNIGKDYYGVFQGFPFVVSYVRESGRGETVFSLRAILNQPVPTQLFNTLSEKLVGFARLAPEMADQNVFAVNVTTDVNQPADAVFDKLILDLVETAESLFLKTSDICPLCLKPLCDAYALVKSEFQPVHAACVHAQSTDIKKSASSGLGWLGALLGGLVGTIPTLLAIFLLSYISAWLCALIPIAAFYGYKLLGGKMARSGYFAIGAVSVLMAPTMDYITYVIELFQQGYGFLSPIDYIYAIMVYPADLLPAILQNLLFIGIGFVVSLSLLNAQLNSAGKKSSSGTSSAMSQSTLRPIDR